MGVVLPAGSLTTSTLADIEVIQCEVPPGLKKRKRKKKKYNIAAMDNTTKPDAVLDDNTTNETTESSTKAECRSVKAQGKQDVFR